MSSLNTSDSRLLAGVSWGPFFFDQPQDLTDCNVSPDADIAGVGVVLGFVIGAFLTTVSSIWAAFLDGMLRNEHRILPTWITQRLPEAGTEKRRRKWQLWRDVLEKLILGFADQQLVTGLALLIAGYVKLFQRQRGDDCYQNAHFYLVVYLACLSSGTHLACILTLRKYLKEHRTTGSVRIVFIILFAMFLTGAIVQIIVYPTAYKSYNSYNWSKPADLVVSILICLAIIYIYWITIMQSIAQEGSRSRAKVVQVLLCPFRLLSCWGRRSGDQHYQPPSDILNHTSKSKSLLRKITIFMVFSNGSMVFLTQIVCSLVSLAFVLVQKFLGTPHGVDVSWIDQNQHTSLNNSQENEFGFGQIVALVLLALPFLSALELYFEEKDEEVVHIYSSTVVKSK